ncbi:MFS transporter [soil metagenome]
MQILAEGKAEEGSVTAVIPLLLLILIDAMGFAMLTPLLASALADGSTAPLAGAVSPGARSLVYGISTGLYPIMTFLGAPLLGQFSDRVGRKSVLLICAGGILLSYAILSAAFAVGSVFLLMAGRFVGGVTAASQAISLAALVDVCRPEKKDFWLSMGLLASSLGFVIGPSLGGLLSEPRIVPWFHIQTPLIATAILAGITLVLFFVCFRDPVRPKPKSQRAPLSLFSGIQSLIMAFRAPRLRRVSQVFLLQELAWGAYFYFIPVFLFKRFATAPTETSLFMGAMGVGFCLSFAIVMPFLTSRYTGRAITFWSLVISSGLIGASLLAPSMLVQWSLILPISLAVSVSYGALIILFTDVATEDSKGEIMGISSAINAFSFGVISFICGAIDGVFAGAPIALSVALMALSCVVFQMHKSPTPDPQPTQ